MSFEKRMKSVSTLFVASVLAVVIFSLVAMAGALVYSNAINVRDPVSSEQLHSVVEGNDSVVNYLEQEKDYEPHFITISNLIRQEQKDNILQSFIVISLPIVIIAVGLAFFVARMLLRPVKEAYESQERFIQDAAHELRNPIAAINATLENSTKNLTPDKQKKLIKMIGRQTRRLVRINEDLLFLEKTTPGEPISKVDLSELLEDVIDGFIMTTNKHHIKLSTKIQSGVIAKMRATDFIKLSRNLIENAIKYSSDKSTVKIELSKDSQITFSVADRGIGIPPEDLDKIGERFFRANNVGKLEGSGLGLAIVNKVVNTYNGDLQIDSKVGKGTTVTVKF